MTFIYLIFFPIIYALHVKTVKQVWIFLFQLFYDSFSFQLFIFVLQESFGTFFFFESHFLSVLFKNLCLEHAIYLVVSSTL